MTTSSAVREHSFSIKDLIENESSPDPQAGQFDHFGLLDGKSVLVTGGTGSLGQVLVRRLLSGRHGTPRKVVVLSRDEGKQHAMRLAYLHRPRGTDEVIYRNFDQALEFRIGDVRDYADVCTAVRDADVVVNAAALKQVPTCEYLPEQAVATNCLGVTNIVRALREHPYPVQTVVGVSTDKACKPVNVMGMTKAIQERMLVAANILSPATRFVAVRYGNVMASRGSVIPLFHHQLAAGGPLTVTDPGMTRFLLTLERAVDIVVGALAHARPGETIVPVTPAATIMDVARAIAGDSGVEIKVTGVRPGEKLHEILISEEEAPATVRRGEWLAIRPMLPELETVDPDDLGEPANLPGAYSSADAVVGLAETTELLRANKLLPGQDGRTTGTTELLR